MNSPSVLLPPFPSASPPIHSCSSHKPLYSISFFHTINKLCFFYFQNTPRSGLFPSRETPQSGGQVLACPARQWQAQEATILPHSPISPSAEATALKGGSLTTLMSYLGCAERTKRARPTFMATAVPELPGYLLPTTVQFATPSTCV